MLFVLYFPYSTHGSAVTKYKAKAQHTWANTALLENTAHLHPLKGAQYGNKSTTFTLIFPPKIQ